MKIKVKEYTIRNGLIRWQITASINVIRAFFASSHRFRDINISKFVTLKMYVKVMITAFTVTPFDGKYLTSFQ